MLALIEFIHKIFKEHKEKIITIMIIKIIWNNEIINYYYLTYIDSLVRSHQCHDIICNILQQRD